jgi:hypothetical protein
MKLNYLVTGTGRSGTVFMARLLTSIGIPCSHEAIFDYKGYKCAIDRLNGVYPLELSWVSRAKYDRGKWQELDPWLPDLQSVQAESSYMVAPFLAEPELQGTTIIHVVRDPIKVIHSFCHYVGYFKGTISETSYEQFIYHHVPELKMDMPQYDRACLFWVRWNQMVESHKPAYRHRIEDGTEGVVKFLDKNGSYFNDNTVNSFKQPTQERFTLEKIKSREIFSEFTQLGRKYGYPMVSEYLLI